MKSPRSGAEYLHRSLVVRTPNIGGAENGACFPYPALRSGRDDSGTRLHLTDPVRSGRVRPGLLRNVTGCESASTTDGRSSPRTDRRSQKRIRTAERANRDKRWLLRSQTRRLQQSTRPPPFDRYRSQPRWPHFFCQGVGNGAPDPPRPGRTNQKCAPIHDSLDPTPSR